MIDSPQPAFLEEFKAEPKWLVWRTEKRGKTITKIPYSARGGTGSSTNPETWSSFAEASAVATRYDGLGFAITDGHVLIDLDGCRDPKTGIIEEWAQFIVDFLQCPTEISPSGTGLHVYAKSKNARSRRRMFSKAGEKKQGIEIYAGGRYSAITFNHLSGTPTEVPEVDLELFLKFVAQGDFDPVDKRIETSCVRWEQDAKSMYTHTRAPLNLEQWTSTYRVDILKRKPDGTLLIACPGTHGEYDKRDGHAFLKQLPSGALAMACLHASCSLSNANGNHWREYRQLVEKTKFANSNTVGKQDERQPNDTDKHASWLFAADPFLSEPLPLRETLLEDSVTKAPVFYRASINELFAFRGLGKTVVAHSLVGTMVNGVSPLDQAKQLQGRAAARKRTQVQAREE